MLERVLPLLVMVLLGVAAGAARLFAEPDRAISTLNRYALYLAFPPLITAAVASDALTVPRGPGFWVVHLVGFAGMVVASMVLARRAAPAGAARGTAAFAMLYGNIAYLGIPWCAAVFGDEAAGLAALSAAIHVTLGMTIGLVVLLAARGDGSASVGAALGNAARQPLVWAPLLGLLLRGAPDAARDAAIAIFQPIGASAGPVALVLLGLYLHTHAPRLRSAGAGTFVVVGAKLLVYPALALAAVTWLPWPLSPLERAVVVLVSGMPVGITAFALAEMYDGGQELAAASIVTSTLLSMATLPVLASWLA